MQKKLIAAAVAALTSTGALAQVTLYGVADVGYFSVDNGTAAQDFSGLRGGLSGNRIGFKANEDLGGGLSAMVLLEYSVGIDDGTSFGGARQSYVGLSSASAGTIVLGRVYAPGYNWAGKYDANSTSQFSPVSNMQITGGWTSTANGPGRLNDTIGYASPNFGGVTVSAAYQFSEEQPGAAPLEAGRVMGVGVDYTAGPLSVGVAYHSGSNIGGAPEKDFTEVSIGASYDLGVAKIVVTYQTLERENSVGGTVDRDRSLASIGASFPIGAGVIKASYATLTNDLAAESTAEANSIGIEYNHSLSKRTTAYVGYTKISNDAGATFSAVGPSAPTAGNDLTAYGVGVRHTF